MDTVKDKKLVMTVHFAVRHTPQQIPKNRNRKPARAGSIETLENYKGLVRVSIKPFKWPIQGDY